MVEKIKNPYFRVDDKMALIIGCSTYDKFRLLEGKSGAQDLPETQEDIRVVCAGLRRLGFSSN